MSIPETGIFVRRARKQERALVLRPVSFVVFDFVMTVYWKNVTEVWRNHKTKIKFPTNFLRKINFFLQMPGKKVFVNSLFGNRQRCKYLV